MPTRNVHLPDDLDAAFAAAAVAEGGRSRLLRRLVESYLASVGEGEVVERAAFQTRGQASKITLRLRAEELGQLERVSRAAGFTRTGWLSALLRAHLFNRPALNPADAEAYRVAGQELNRIGRNINQIARAMNVAVLEGAIVKSELQSVEAARAEIRAIALDLRDALSGNRDYWGRDA